VYDDNDDDDFELINGRKVLKDGRTLHVPMTRMSMMDGLDEVQRAVARDAEKHRVTDANGSTLGLHRPGFRVSDVFATDERRRIYDGYDAELRDAYKMTKEFVGQREGDLCTINGFPGHLHRDANGRLTCVPDVRRDGMQDERQAAYAEYTRTLENSWRNP
jgi:hypothetical protein